MRIVILANGASPGSEKLADRHFICIDGEPLLERTARQFRPHGDVVISGPDLRYKLDGTSLFVPEDRPSYLDAAILLDTVPLWSGLERTIVLLGDTVFSDAAVAAIIGHEDHGWTYYGRFAGSRYSGTDYGELFGYSFRPRDQARGLATMLEVRARQRDGLWRGGLWEHYRLLHGLDPERHEIRGGFVEIDDETDDIDFAPQLNRWLQATGRA